MANVLILSVGSPDSDTSIDSNKARYAKKKQHKATINKDNKSSAKNDSILNKRMGSISSAKNYRILNKSMDKNISTSSPNLHDEKNMNETLPDAGYENDPSKNDNLKFYTGQIKSKPDGDFIEHILSKWYGDYKLLEKNHSYIQWLFPTKEGGSNPEAQPLQWHELTKLRKDPIVRLRLLTAYKMMLDFYGLTMTDSGELARANHYQERYKNLYDHPHNNLRITRILQCLREFGFKVYQMEFIEFLVKEIYETKTLDFLQESFNKYWIYTIKSDKVRKGYREYINEILK